jgi:hypothetical protein
MRMGVSIVAYFFLKKMNISKYLSAHVQFFKTTLADK